MLLICHYFLITCNKYRVVCLFSHSFQVVQNKNITKTQKVRFFTAEVLIHIASLYRWNGITDVSPGDLKVW